MKPIISYAGYVNEISISKIFLIARFKDCGKLVVDDSGFRFEGKNGDILIPKMDVKSVDLVYEIPMYYTKYMFVALNIWMIISYIIHIETSFNILWFLLSISIVNLLLFLLLYRSSWMKIVYKQESVVKTIYLSVVWNINVFPEWRFLKDFSLLSYLDNKRIVKEFRKVIADNQSIL